MPLFSHFMHGPRVNAWVFPINVNLAEAGSLACEHSRTLFASWQIDKGELRDSCHFLKTALRLDVSGPPFAPLFNALGRVYIETGRRPNRPPIAGSGRLLFPTAGAAGGARFVYTAAAVLYTHYTASTNYLPLALMSSQFDWHCHWHRP